MQLDLLFLHMNHGTPTYWYVIYHILPSFVVTSSLDNLILLPTGTWYLLPVPVPGTPDLCLVPGTRYCSYKHLQAQHRQHESKYRRYM